MVIIREAATIQEAEADRVPVKARHRLQKAKPLRLAELLIK